MNLKVYKTPDPHNRLDASELYERGIADILLTFGKGGNNTKEGINRIVTVPAKNEAGFNVAACQAYLQEAGNAVYVLVPETERLYSFTEAVFPIRDAGERFLKAGLRGLFFGAEKKGLVCQPAYEDDSTWLAVCSQNISQDDWYHFTGTAAQILEELQKKCIMV